MHQNIHNNPELAAWYLKDLIAILKEEAFRGIDIYNRAHIKGQDYSKDNSYNEGYNCGFAHAYSRVISLMLYQAKDYGIPLSDLGLNDIDRDKDLMDGV